MTYTEFCEKCFNDRTSNEMLPDGTSDEEALDILIKHFLGDFIVYGYPCGHTQYNSEAIAEILRLYPQGSIRRIKPRY